MPLARRTSRTTTPSADDQQSAAERDPPSVEFRRRGVTEGSHCPRSAVPFGSPQPGTRRRMPDLQGADTRPVSRYPTEADPRRAALFDWGRDHFGPWRAHRKESVDDEEVGSDRPHVVKLPSPEQDISRNHLEIRLDDWHVLVTDLNSTNGTVITRPGRDPERLRPDQSTMIEPGTVVDLAEVVSFTFDATG